MKTYYIVVLALMILAGCYTAKKATQQLNRAVSAYPELGANYCAFAYPIKEKTTYIKGKDSIKHDTTQTFINCDSAINAFNKAHPNATPEEKKAAAEKVYVTNVKHDTIFRTDTVKITEENTAWVKALQIDSSKMSNELIAANKAIDKKNRTLLILWIVIGAEVVLLGIGAYFKFLK